MDNDDDGEHCVGMGSRRGNSKGTQQADEEGNNPLKVQEEIQLVAELKSCAQRKDLFKGSRIHADISRRGFLKHNIFLGSALVNMYAKCGALVKAQKAFDELPFQSVVSWNGLISGYAQHGLGEEALACFDEMQQSGLSPNARTFTCTLKACGSIGAVEKGKEVYANIVKKGLIGTDTMLGNALIDMCAKCAALAKARQVFDDLPVRNAVSWNTLIAGYCHHGKGEEALTCFEQMKHVGLMPDVVTFACILTACGIIRSVLKGKEIHDEIARKGLLANGCVLCTALLDMYAKCGAFSKAREVFKKYSLSRDVISWTALITGYCQHGHDEEALDCFGQMRREGLSPDAVTFASVLKACGSIGAVEKGEEIHAEIVRDGFLGRVYVLLSALLDMYIKCGALAKAKKIFDELPSRDVVTWTALIAGYSQHGYGDEALKCFELMKCEGLSPDAVSFSCILRTCCRVGAAEKGQAHFDSMHRSYNIIPNAKHHLCMMDLYGHVGHFDKVMTVLEKMSSLNEFSTWIEVMNSCQKWGNLNLGRLAFKQAVQLNRNSMQVYVCMANIFAACGMQENAYKTLAEAQRVLDEPLAKDVLSWNTLISGYCQNGQGEEALKCFERMKQNEITPDAVTFTCILKACSSTGAYEKGKEIHAEIVREGLLGKVQVLGNALVNMYVRCGALVKAQRVLNDLPVSNMISWNALITGYCQHRHGEKALYSFEQMVKEGVSPDAITFACILNACGSIGAAEKGKEMHLEIVRKGLLADDVVLGNTLVDMYAKCGSPSMAQQVFDELPIRNLISWNALITGYSQYGHGEEALNSFEQMKREGLSPNAVTFACIIKVCGSIGAFQKGKEIHAEVAEEGLLGEVNILGNAVVNMYAKCGALAEAQQLLHKLPARNLVSWNGLIVGYCQQGHAKEALGCFEIMKRDGISPNVATFAHILKVCGSTGALEIGKEIHAEIIKEGLLRSNIIGTALMNMYNECGALASAEECFGKLSVQDVVSWTSLMTGYCQLGRGEEALQCFEQMENEGLFPDVVTFACILKACGSIGAAEKCQRYLETMGISYRIMPTPQHYTYMVNLFSHLGHFDRASVMIKKMPSCYYSRALFSLMCACQKWGNLKLGKLAFEHAVELDGTLSVTF